VAEYVGENSCRSVGVEDTGLGAGHWKQWAGVAALLASGCGSSGRAGP